MTNTGNEFLKHARSWWKYNLTFSFVSVFLFITEEIQQALPHSRSGSARAVSRGRWLKNLIKCNVSLKNLQSMWALDIKDWRFSIYCGWFSLRRSDSRAERGSSILLKFLNCCKPICVYSLFRIIAPNGECLGYPACQHGRGEGYMPRKSFCVKLYFVAGGFGCYADVFVSIYSFYLPACLICAD